MEEDELEAFNQWLSAVEHYNVREFDRTEAQMWLLKAAWSGLYDGVNVLLDKHISVEKDEFPHDALQAAIYCGHERVATRLLDDIPNVNLSGGFFENALQAACLGGHPGLTMKLLDMGADANAWGRHGSPLKAACFGGHDDVVRLLIRRGAVMDATNGKWNALEAATSRGYLSTSKILVESFPWAIAQKTRKYSSIHNVLEAALEMAALGGYSKIVEYLLQNGAETFLLQALEAALRGCHSKVIQVLLATISKLEDYTRFEVGNCSYTSPDAWIKADFDTLLDNRQTVEDWWRPKEDADVLLKERYVFFTSRVSETSWWQQSKTNGPGSRQTLGMDDPQGMQYIRALAAYRCTRPEFEALVAKGLDLEAHSASAIEVAAKGGNLGVLEYLLDRDTDLKGALQIAVLCQKPQAVETILKKRPNTNPDVVASLNQQGNSEQRIKEMSALALAVEQKDEEMVALILEHGRKSGPGEGLLESVRRNDSYFAEMILKATCRPSIQVWSEDGIVSALKSAQMATYLNNMSILQQILDAAEFLSYEKTRFVRAIVHGATSPTLALPEERRDRGWERTRRRRNKEPGEQQTMMSPSQRQQRLIDVLKLVEGRLTKPDEEEIACSILQAQLDDPETMLENLELFGSYISPHINSHRFRKSVRQAFESLLEQLQCNRAMQLVDRYPEHQSILREPQILQAALKYTPNGCCTLWWGLCEKHTKHLSKTLRSLIRAGAPLDGKDDEGHTPLYYACSMGWQVAFTLLVEAGADINVMQTLEVEDGPQSTQQDRHEDLTPELAITDLLHISLRRFLLCYNYQSLTFHQHWSSIIFYLLDAHMPCTLDDPGLSLLLESACRHGQIEEVKKLLYPDMWTHATPVPVERHFLNKSQGLCHAVRLGHMEIASMLLKHHVDPRVKQFDKQKNKEVSPIQACLADVNKAKGWEEVCDMLIDHGVSEEDAEAFLDHAVRAHQSERIRRLLDRGTRIPQLYGSVRPDTLTLLLDPKYRALVNFDGMLKELPSWIRWVKHQDDAIGRLEVVQKLSLVLPPIRGLVEGILQNHDIGEAGQIFLLDYLMLLYEHDVNASFPCKCGNPVTFLFEAISNNRAEVFQALLDQGADPNDPVLPYQGLILLCRRARFRQEKAAIKMASILLERGADINSTASKNDTSSEIHELTPLMYSVSHRDTKMVSWLIERGADVNRGFVAPLSLAFRVDFPQRQMIHLLLESGARSRQHDITKEYLLDPAIGLGPDNYWHHKYCHDCGLYKVYDM